MFLAYNLFGFSYWTSTFLNYFFGSILSFLLNKYYTFQTTSKSFKEIALFIINIAICYFIAYFVAAKLVQLVLNGYEVVVVDNVSMVVGMVLFVLMNYIGQKFIVFKK